MRLPSFRRLGRDAKLFIAEAAVSSLVWGAWWPISTLYLKEAGYTGTALGTLGMVSGLTSVLSLPAGLVVDRFGRKRILLLSWFASMLGPVAVVLTTDLQSLLTAFLVSGVAGAALGPAYSALQAEAFEEDMESGYSLESFVRSISSAAGGLVGWIPESMAPSLGYLSAYRTTLIALLALEAPSIVLLSLVRERYSPKERAGISVRARGVVARFAVTQAVIGFGAGLSIPLIGYYLSVKFGVESGPIGTLFTVVSVVGGVSNLAAPALSDRVGLLAGILLPQAAAIPLLAAIPACPSFLCASLLYVPRTALMNMSNPLLWAFVMRVTPEEDRGAMSAVSQLAWNVPNSLSTQVGGWMMDSVGLDSPLLCTSAVYSIYLVVFYLLFRGFLHGEGEDPDGLHPPD